MTGITVGRDQLAHTVSYDIPANRGGNRLILWHESFYERDCSRRVLVALGLNRPANGFRESERLVRVTREPRSHTLTTCVLPAPVGSLPHESREDRTLRSTGLRQVTRRALLQPVLGQVSERPWDRSA